MKRRLMITQALVHQPPMIILDEPTAGVDVELRKTLWQFIKKLNQKGHTIILTTHYLEAAEQFARIAFMKNGQLISLDQTEQLLNIDNDIHASFINHTLNSEKFFKNFNFEYYKNKWTFQFNNYQPLEQLLKIINTQHLDISNLQILEKNLEQTFYKLNQMINDTYGIFTLFKKETLRLIKVGIQTVGSLITSSLLYLLIFSNTLPNKINIYKGISYIQFLIPGLIMISIMQNTFANVSSNLIQSKILGNIVLILLPPLSNLGFIIAFVGAVILRGLIVGLGIFVCSFIFEPTIPQNYLWTLSFAFLGGACLSILGLIADIIVEKFDQIALFQNFIIMPFTFLAGVFYSIQSLPYFWHAINQVNPFFYLVDKFRYDFCKPSDIIPTLSMSMSLICFILLTVIPWMPLKTGHQLKSSYK